MRYWSFFAAKIAVASVALYGLLFLLDLYLPHGMVAVTAPKIHATPPAPPVTGSEANNQRDVIWLVPGAVATPAPEAKLLAPLSNGADRLLCSLGLMAWFLLAVGVGYLIVWDQR